MKKKLLIILAIIIIFVVAFFVRYYPILHKGFPSNVADEILILARNLSLTDEYKITDEKNIVLSSSLIKEKGVPSVFGNRLTSILYSKLFKAFGFNYNIPIYTTLLLYAVINVLLFLLILKLFNLKVALIFSGIDIFTPVVLKGAGTPGLYEFAILFFVLALLFYLYKEKASWLNLVLAGIFFGLAALSRNAFLVSFIPFVIYDWWKNKSFKRVAIFILPFILIWGGMMIYDSSLGITSRYLAKGDIGYDGHLFPDPYTYHFEKEEYIKSIEGTSHSMLNEFLLKYGYKVSLKNKILMYFDSIKYYLADLLRLITVGGPLILLFAGAGIVYLWKKKKHLMVLFGIWFVIWGTILVYLKTNNWDHFLEISFPLILLITVGIYWLAEHIWKSDIRTKFKYILLFCLFISLILHFNRADKWLFHDIYRNGATEIFLALAQDIKNSGVTQDDVIAVGPLAGSPDRTLNYYTDFNYIYFDSETIKKLLKENRLQWAFDQFRVTKIVAYNEDLTEQIVKATNVQNLAILPCY